MSARLKSIILGAPAAPGVQQAQKMPASVGRPDSTLRIITKTSKRRRKTSSATLLRDP